MDNPKETVSESLDSSLSLHNSNSLPHILTDINLKAQKMLRLVKNSDDQPNSTEKFLGLYHSLGETYNSLNQEVLKTFNLDLKVPMGHEMGRSLSEVEKKKKESAYMIADIFCAELETARRELEAEKRKVVELESKLVDSSDKIEILGCELAFCKEFLDVSEAEVSKLKELKTENAKIQTDNDVDELLDSLREELRSRDVQIGEMEEYLNKVCCVKEEDIPQLLSESRTVEELRTRVEELEEEKRDAIRELCFSLDYYMTKYKDLVSSLSATL